MENKKLVNILLKDMGELEELVAEMKEKGGFDSFEIEFLHTRAKGIMHLLQMLNGHGNEKVIQEVAPKIVDVILPKIEEEKIEEPVIETPVEEKIQVPEIKEEVKAPEVQKEPEIEAEKPKEIISEKEPEPELVELKDEEIQAEEIVEDKPTEIAENLHENDDVELEEEEVVAANQRLGDSFLKGKSVNDIILEPSNLESKLSNRPVASLRSAIGINDRFQYIRELFEGSSDKFSQTVTSIDEMNTINEAVSYLQQNFKWKKNEASLKFVNLVKRRFTND